MENGVMRIFLSAPYSDGDTATDNERSTNMDRAKTYALAVLATGHDVYCPHFALHFLEGEPDSWERAVSACEREIALCDEVWQFGEETPGMKRERETAERLGIPVRRKG